MKTLKSSLTTIAFGSAATLIFLLFLIRSDAAIDYMKIGLRLCATSVIPSLFPFTAASTLLISSGAGTKLCRPLALICRPLLGISEGGACASILGNLCGFPIGAKSLCDMYDRGMISKQEFERVLTFSNNPGSAFVISTLGLSLFGNIRIGILLYVCVILSSLIIGVTLRIFGKKIPLSATAGGVRGNIEPPKNAISLFTSAIRDSALSMLTVCAMIAFFSAFSGCVGATLSRIGADKFTTALLSAFFEMSGGVSALSSLGKDFSVILCAAALGWSGLSVHFQVMSLCAGRNINFAPYFISKAAQSLISAILAAISIRLFPIFEDVYISASNSFWQKDYNDKFILFWCVLSLAIAISAVLSAFGKIARKNFYKKRRKILQKGVDK